MATNVSLSVKSIKKPQTPILHFYLYNLDIFSLYMKIHPDINMKVTQKDT